MSVKCELSNWMQGAAVLAATLTFAMPATAQRAAPGGPSNHAMPISSNSNTDYSNTYVPNMLGPGFAAANAYANEQAEERRKEADRIARASFQRAVKDMQALTEAASGLKAAAANLPSEKDAAELLARVKKIERLSHDLIQASVQR